jgi:cell division protein FtsW
MKERSFLYLPVIILFLTGLVVIFSTTSAEVLDLELDKSTHYALAKQIAYFILGLVVAFITYLLGYKRLIELSPYLFVFAIFLLVLTLIPGIGKVVNGSRRWLGFNGFSFQPSEFVKIILPAFFIYRIQKYNEALSFNNFIKELIIISLPIVLILIEPNNGTAGVIFISLVVLFFLMKIKAKFWAIPLLICIFVGVMFASNHTYVNARLNAYLHPESDLKGKGHQPYQAKIAAGSGKILGKGPGKSLQKLSYLPEAQNDYIAAIYAEEYGFIGIVCLLLLYCVIAYKGFQISFLANEPQALYFSAILTFLISFQAFLNLGVVSGLLPTTGLNLPFFSQGGTSLIANLSSVAILLSIAKNRAVTQTN